MNSWCKCCIACNLSKFKNSSPSAHHGPLHNLNFPQNFHPSLFPLLLESLVGLMPLALATEIMHSQTLLLLALNIVQTFIIIASFLLPALLSSNHSLLDEDNSVKSMSPWSVSKCPLEKFCFILHQICFAIWSEMHKVILFYKFTNIFY